MLMSKYDDSIRKIWDKTMSAELGMPHHYSSVAVLTIHWIEALDGDLNSRIQVEPLAKLFRDDFDFDVHVVQLNVRPKRPQLQLVKAVTDSLYGKDGHHKSHLLIVYYTGHGFVRFDRPHELIFSGKAHDEDAFSEDSFPPNANWTIAERALEDAQADTLVILDCCCAGNVMNGRSVSGNTRSYEVMAATGKNRAATMPGPSSYTHALIRALEALAQGETSFSTFDLSQEINQLRHYSDQSRLYSRLAGTTRHIKIARPARHHLTPSSREQQVGSSLDVRIGFVGHESSCEDDLRTLAHDLSKLPTSTRLDICNIGCTGFVRHGTTAPSTADEKGVAKNHGLVSSTGTRTDERMRIRHLLCSDSSW